MPTYDYECKTCGHTFDAFQSMSDDPLSVCPSCGKKSLRRLIGGGLGVIFKGSGFYVTDSRSSSGSKKGSAAAKSDSGGSESTSTDKTTDTKKPESSSDSGTTDKVKAAG